MVRLIEAGVSILNAVKGASESELHYARKESERLGWRIGVAVDVELCCVQPAGKGGRGKKDTERVGVKAAVQSQASKQGLSTSTIWLNIRIFKTFFKTDINNYSSLADKGYFHAALRAPDHIKAIRHFERAVAGKETFEVMDAYRWADSERAKVARKPVVDKTDAVCSKEDNSLRQHIRTAVAEFEKLKAACPDKQFARQYYDSIIEDFQDHLLLMSEKNDERRCIAAWEQGYRREAQMSVATGLSRKQVAMAMERLSEARQFYEVEEHTHGKHDKLWQCVNRAPRKVLDPLQQVRCV